MDSTGSLRATERAFQDLLERHSQEREEARADRRQAFIHEHEVVGRSYAEIAAELGLTRGRVIHVIKGYQT